MQDTYRFDLRKISMLRTHLEGFAARLAALQAGNDSDGIQTLHSAQDELNRAIANRDYPAFRTADYRLHETLVNMAQTPLLREAWLSTWQSLVGLHHSSFEECWPDIRVLSREHEYLVEAIGLQDPDAAEDAARNHIEAVWFRLAELRGDAKEGDALERAEAYLAFRLSSPLRLEEVAKRAAYTSPGNLSRLFRRRHGIGFQAYLQNMRLEKAAELLVTTGLPVARIARRVGYRDVSRFGQHFRRRYSATPTQWRAMHRRT